MMNLGSLAQLRTKILTGEAKWPERLRIYLGRSKLGRGEAQELFTAIQEFSGPSLSLIFGSNRLKPDDVQALLEALQKFSGTRLDLNFAGGDVHPKFMAQSASSEAIGAIKTFHGKTGCSLEIKLKQNSLTPAEVESLAQAITETHFNADFSLNLNLSRSLVGTAGTIALATAIEAFRGSCLSFNLYAINLEGPAGSKALAEAIVNFRGRSLKLKLGGGILGPNGELVLAKAIGEFRGSSLTLNLKGNNLINQAVMQAFADSIKTFQGRNLSLILSCVYGGWEEHFEISGAILFADAIKEFKGTRLSLDFSGRKIEPYEAQALADSIKNFKGSHLRLNLRTTSLTPADCGCLVEAVTELLENQQLMPGLEIIVDDSYTQAQLNSLIEKLNSLIQRNNTLKLITATAGLIKTSSSPSLPQTCIENIASFIFTNAATVATLIQKIFFTPMPESLRLSMDPSKLSYYVNTLPQSHAQSKNHELINSSTENIIQALEQGARSKFAVKKKYKAQLIKDALAAWNAAEHETDKISQYQNLCRALNYNRLWLRRSKTTSLQRFEQAITTDATAPRIQSRP